MRIAITGATGLVGSALVPALADKGNAVAGLVRGTPRDPERETKIEYRGGEAGPFPRDHVHGDTNMIARPWIALATILLAAAACTGLSSPERAEMSQTAAHGYAAMPPAAPAPGGEDPGDEGNTERYSRIDENPFRLTEEEPLSTFSIDVDTASYANVRRFLTDGQLPPADAVRIEELVNYFDYDYPAPSGAEPFSVSAEVAACPWEPKHRLVRIGLMGRRVDVMDRPPSNLVFLLDVSGSMAEENKLPLLKRAFSLLTEQLDGKDRVAIVVYAGASGLVLESTRGDERSQILGALDRLDAGGSTNGGAGIQLAYSIAQENFVRGGVNRVILATDGDFNVGTTNEGELTRIVEEKAKSGVFLSVLGFGMGNYNDSMLEEIADRGNGNYAYIDTFQEAKKVLGEQVAGTLLTIAKDVKIQVEFNPRRVSAFRLIGYENRILAHQDFDDDRKDAGEIGSGHTVTALYQVVPAGVDVEAASTGPLRYQGDRTLSEEAESDELLTVKLRYKQPDGDTSRLLEVAVADSGAGVEGASDDFLFASAVGAFGMCLRGSEHRGQASWDLVLELAQSGRGRDVRGWRAEFIELAKRARSLSRDQS